MAQKIMQPKTEYGKPDDLLKWSKQTKNKLESTRFLALRMLMNGLSRQDVMDVFGISWSTLQKWVRLWNKGGKDFVSVGKPTGRPSKMTQEAKDFIVRKIEFTSKKTGERITGLAISGTLKKSIRDQIKEKCDLLLASQDGMPPAAPKKNSGKKG